jgi:hypothetical protein
LAGVEALQLTAGELLFSDGQAGAMEAHWSHFFECEAQRIGGATEGPGAE